MQAEGFDPLHAGVDRLDEAGLLEGDLIGNANRTVLDDPIHDADVFGKPAAGRLKACRAAYFLISRALRKSFVLAIKTFAAWDVMENHHPVAGTVLGYTFADCGHYAGSFVSEDARRGMGAGSNL